MKSMPAALLLEGFRRLGNLLRHGGKSAGRIRQRFGDCNVLLSCPMRNLRNYLLATMEGSEFFGLEQRRTANAGLA